MMKKLLFLLVAFMGLQLSAQTAGKEKIQKLFEVNGKLAYYNDYFATNPSVNTTEFLAEAGTIYKKYLSEADIQTMIDFYSSEEGKKVLRGEVPRSAETGMPGYDAFMKSTAMRKYLKSAKKIGQEESALIKKYEGKK